MVDEKPRLQEVNAKLSGAGLRCEMIAVELLDLVDKNARYMPADQYRRLVDNIKRDGALTSVPFAVKRGERFLVLSGNHRVQAARDAGLKEILVLYTDRTLSRSEELGIQLSHNQIVGQDDMTILRELYAEIDELAMKEYSGWDDATLEKLTPPEIKPLSEQALEMRVVSIIFLPEEVERAEACFDEAMHRATGDKTWVNRRSEYDRMLDLLTQAKKAAGVKNTATAFMLLLEVASRHMEEIGK
jgi:hypothetical protein